MIGIFGEALRLQNFCDGQGWTSCLSGGIAASLGWLPFEAQAVEDAGVGGALTEWHG